MQNDPQDLRNTSPASSLPRLIVFLAIYVTMFLFGFVENIKDVAAPLIKLEFSASYLSQGGLLSTAWFGYVIMCFVASIALEKLGAKRSLMLGYLFVVAGALLMLTVRSFFAATLVLMLVTAGFGFFEVSTNALATVAFTVRAALLMNLMHFFYGAGSVAGPMFAGALIKWTGAGWRTTYLWIAIPTAVIGVFFLTRNLKVHSQAAQDEKPAMRFFEALRHPTVLMIAATLGFMEIIEFGAANWSALHLLDVYGLPVETTGALFVGVFYACFTASRLLSGIAIERIGLKRSLYIMSAAALILFVVGFALGSAGIWLLPVTGFFIAPMWPTIMALGMQVFGRNAPIATSAIITASGAINGLGQVAIGWINKYLGFAWGYRSCALFAVVVIVLLSVLYQRFIPTRREDEPSAV